MRNIPALILAGGQGVRLRSAIGDRQKALAPVNGRPFVTFILDQLERAGFRDVLLCTGYRSEQVSETLGSAYGGLSLAYSEEGESLGTAGALRNALSGFHSDVCMVMNGDSFLKTDLHFYAKRFLDDRAPAALLLTGVPDASRYGRVLLESSGSVTGFSEKGASTEAGIINAGIYFFRRALLEDLPSTCFSLEKDVFPALASRGELSGYCCTAPFIDIGVPADYEFAQDFFRLSYDGARQ